MEDLTPKSKEHHSLQIPLTYNKIPLSTKADNGILAQKEGFEITPISVICCCLVLFSVIFFIFNHF